MNSIKQTWMLLRDVDYELRMVLSIFIRSINLESLKIQKRLILYLIFTYMFAWIGNVINSVLFWILFSLAMRFVKNPHYDNPQAYEIFNTIYSLTFVSTTVMFITKKMFFGFVIGLIILWVIDTSSKILGTHNKFLKTVEYVHPSSDFLCLVCYTSEKDIPIIKIKRCGHMYHADCYRFWINNSQGCCVIPYCQINTTRPLHDNDTINTLLFEIRINGAIRNNQFPFVVHKHQIFADLIKYEQFGLDPLVFNMVSIAAKTARHVRPLTKTDQTVLSCYENILVYFPEAQRAFEYLYLIEIMMHEDKYK